jgi:hypothetical protein
MEATRRSRTNLGSALAAQEQYTIPLAFDSCGLCVLCAVCCVLYVVCCVLCVVCCVLCSPYDVICVTTFYGQLNRNLLQRSALCVRTYPQSHVYIRKEAGANSRTRRPKFDFLRNTIGVFAARSHFLLRAHFLLRPPDAPAAASQRF